ncbi:hypothetical protein ACFL4T_02240 [candidate division KSB1 bacterium]
MNVSNLKPGVPRSALLLLAGLMWIIASVMLLKSSFSWLEAESKNNIILIAGTGFFFALIIHHFGFLHLVDKNTARILPMEGRKCLFSFFSWKNYILISVMLLFGFLLRQIPGLNKYLAVLYISIGLALFLSSIRYIRYTIMVLRHKL